MAKGKAKKKSKHSILSRFVEILTCCCGRSRGRRKLRNNIHEDWDSTGVNFGFEEIDGLESEGNVKMETQLVKFTMLRDEEPQYISGILGIHMDINLTTGFTKSHILAESIIKLDQDTIPARIKQFAQDDPEQIAFVFRYPEKPRETLTRRELFEKVDALGRNFVNVGIKPGDKVAINLSSGSTWIIVQFGLYVAGAVAVNALSFEPGEFERLTKNLGCAATVVENATSSNETTKNSTVFSFIGRPDYTFTIEERLANEMPKNVDLPNLSSHQEVALFFTSGSSGFPKLVSHSHSTILSSGYLMMSVSTGNQVLLNDRPMCWAGGYPFHFIWTGEPIVHVCTKLDSEKYFLEVILEEKPSLVVIMEYRLHQMQRDKQLLSKMPHLPTITTGGQRVTVETAQSLLNFCDQLTTGYGSTESLFVTFVSIKDMTLFQDGLVGRPLKCCEIKLIDSEGQIVPVGQDGKVCVRGPTIAKEYIHLDGTREATLDEEGWFHTGDIGFFRPDGLLVITGRETETIKRATVRLSPAFIERKLRENLDVLEVAVVGIPDDILHQEVCACIVPKSDSHLTVTQVQKRAVEIFQPSLAPDGLGYMPGFFLLMEEFPKTHTGKTKKPLLATKAYEKIKSEKMKTQI